MKKTWFFATLLIGGLSSICLAYSGGDGTVGNPYQISDANDLLELAADTSNYNKNFILTADIDLGGQIFTQAIIAPDIDNDEGFFQGTPFAGTVDGNGHEITHFTVNGGNRDFLGLFGFIGLEGQIKNLGMTDVNITGNAFVGSLCGYNNAGIISGCYTTGVISGRYHIGGLCGWNEKGTINACYASSTVSGEYEVGGLCGWNKEGTVSVSYAAGAVSGTNDIGGLCGYSNGDISACYATGTVIGGDNVGGLCGWNFGTISDCYATGLIGGSSHTAGFCGRNDYTALITDSFWDIETSGLTNSDGGEGKTTVEMQILSTFMDAGWDFSGTDGDIADWFMSGNEYPHLISEITVAVPNLVGQIFSGIETILREMGLRLEITRVVSDSVPAGIVIHQSPTAGQQAMGGSIVNLLVSIGKPYSGGSGIESDPYKIATRGDLLTLAVTTIDYTKHFVLTAEIDMEGQTFAKAIIAPDTDNSTVEFDGTAFTGILDGNGYQIKNFTITGQSNDYIGLFGYLGPSGLIKNLGVVSADIQGRWCVAGLCGWNQEGIIIACYTIGTVSGEYYVGGLCGYNEYGGEISNCYTAAAINGIDIIGGLCGENISRISDCYATGSASGDSMIGGLCGINHGYVGNSYARGSVSGTSEIGGLIGHDVSNSVYSSFWDIETSGLTNSDGGEGKTTAEMKTLSTFTDASWDFSNSDGDLADWIMSGIDYPHLIWEIPVMVPDVVGQTQSEAKAALMEIGLLVEITGIVSDSVPFGIVISHWPAAGQQTRGGMAMTLFVSIGKPYPGGSGTESDPFQIADANNLLTMAADINNYDKSFVLTVDIDLEGRTFSTSIIAPNTNPEDIFQGTAFTGVFDGKGYKIKNFVINGGSCNTLGLFGFIESDGQVRNLGLESCTIHGLNRIGGLCGFNLGVINTCYVTGTVSGNYDIGGLCGLNGGEISKCYTMGATSGIGGVGGLCGNNHGTMSTCYATGAVSGADYIGGLCGGCEQGIITTCYATGVVSGDNSIGGLCGWIYSATITNSFWDVESSGLSSSVGGIGKTTIEMKSLSTFISVGWDFINETANGINDYWRMCVDDVDYPRLNWESINGDFACPDGVSVEDLDYFVGRWLLNSCTSENNYCGGADMDATGAVQMTDFSIFAQHWLEQM